ncbi:MAG: hypothetical protein KKF41_13615 [Actinobacteria bacterium]|nr:hypothetical protein [Actinomycetota bacterium]MBU2688613.1 hypothetical protein [Actinomycetota bacterium]
MDSLEATDWMIGIGGIVLVVASFIGFYGYGLVFPLLGIGAVVLVVLEKLVRVPAIEDFQYLSWVYVGIGGLALLIALGRLIQLLTWAGVLILGGWWITVILELLASGAILAGGIIRQRQGY